MCWGRLTHILWWNMTIWPTNAQRNSRIALKWYQPVYLSKIIWKLGQISIRAREVETLRRSLFSEILGLKRVSIDKFRLCTVLVSGVCACVHYACAKQSFIHAITHARFFLFTLKKLFSLPVGKEKSPLLYAKRNSLRLVSSWQEQPQKRKQQVGAVSLIDWIRRWVTPNMD